MKEFECNSKKSTLGPFPLGYVKIHQSEYLASLLECDALIWDAGRPSMSWYLLLLCKTIFFIYNLKRKSFPWEMKRAKT